MFYLTYFFGRRYIEIFRSSLGEICQDIGVRRSMASFPQRPAPYDARDRFGGPNRFRNSNMGGGPNGLGRNFRGNRRLGICS